MRCRAVHALCSRAGRSLTGTVHPGSHGFAEGGIQQHGCYGYSSLAALAQVCTATQLATPHDSPSRLHRQQRCKSTASGIDVNSDMTSRLFVGAYTLVTKSLWQERLSKRGTPPQDAALPPIIDKHPHVTSVQYPFTTDREFLEMYRNPWNFIRIGRVLEDMDSMAGNIAFTHCDDGDPSTMPPMLVTAAVEKIQIVNPVDLEHDATLSGQVVYTGSSSMDVRLMLQQSHLNHPSIIALFTFVARDPATQKATRINPIVPQTSQQKQWFEERAAVAEARKAARKAAQAMAMSCAGAAQAVSSAARAGLGQLEERRTWTKSLLAEARLMNHMPGLTDGGSILMDSTRLSNTFTCQPQNRNMHGRMFGGFLMRRAYELAYATAHLFCGTRPRFVQVDRVDFKKPVDVGDLVTFASCIMHAKNILEHSKGPQGRMYVEVEASVNRPEQRTTFPTNTFQFTFETQLAVASDPVAPKVRLLKRILPSTEAQASDIEVFYEPETASGS